MELFFAGIKSLQDRVRIARVHFRYFSRVERFHLLRSMCIIVVCLVGFLTFGIDLTVSAQNGVLPSTAYEVHQYDELKSTQVDVESLKREVEEIQADRQKRRDESQAWRQDIHDRVSRVETIGTVVVGVIGVLNTLGFLRKFKSAEERMTGNGSDG